MLARDVAEGAHSESRRRNIWDMLAGDVAKGACSERGSHAVETRPLSDLSALAWRSSPEPAPSQ
ncbi:hypothetical protein HDC37_002748 [Microbacterium sp. AK009]|nr:hypothetical protein [Microbacterium sp. AK009]